MPNDARLGLVVGVTLVILIAVLFFGNDGRPSVAAGSVQTPAARPAPREARRTTPLGRPTAPEGQGAQVRSHEVREGESLSSVARQYYGEGSSRVLFLYHSNRDRLRAPNHVPVGTVLLVPDLPADVASLSE